MNNRLNPLTRYVVDPLTGCWEWQGSKDAKGYGLVRDYAAKKTRRATHLFYAEFGGPVPDGMCVCHTCDNPSCVNPDHLWLGDNLANVADCVAKGRHARGEMQGQAVLTAEQVLYARERNAEGGITQRELAEELGVSRSTLWSALCGKSWDSVDEASVHKPRKRGSDHCKRGHLFDEQNTMHTYDGKRKCRACQNITRKQRARK